MLAAAEGQEAPALAAKDDSVTRTKAVALDFAFAGEPRGSMQGRAARPQGIDQPGQQREAAHQSTRHCADDLRIAAIIPDKCGHLDRVIGGHRQAEDGRSVEGVFRFLDINSAASARVTIGNLIKKFVVSNHLMIAGQKLATGGRFTYRFTLDDGCLVDGEFGEYTYTQPRIVNLLTFARDAQLVDEESGKITAAGTEFLNAA